MYEVKQFKLISGEEIVCEVVEWAQEGDDQLIVRNAMQIENRYWEEEITYLFHPWMLYIENPLELIVMSSNHVLALTNPSPHLLSQYKEAVYDMNETSDFREVYAQNKLAKELEDFEENVVKKLKSIARVNDSDKSNVIQFPTNSIH